MKKELKNSDLPDDGLDDDILAVLAECSQFKPPAAFVQATVTQFEAAVRRKLFGVIALGIVAALSISTPLFWFILLNIKEVTKAMAACLRGSAIVGEIWVTLWSQLPEMSTGIILALWVAMFIVAAMLVKVFKVSTLKESAVN